MRASELIPFGAFLAVVELAFAAFALEVNSGRDDWLGGEIVARMSGAGDLRLNRPQPGST